MTEQQYFEKVKKVQRKEKQTADKAQNSMRPIQEMNPMDLQRMVGNRQAQRLLAGTPALKPSTFIQTKMSVGAADDAYEREADSVAEQVMSSPAADAPAQRTNEDEMQAKRIVQRADEDEMQTKRDIQRAETPQEDQLAMKRELAQRAGEEEESEDEQIATKRDIQREEMPDDEMQAKRDIQRAGEEEESEDEQIATKRDIQRANNEDMMGAFEVGGNIENQINAARGGGSPLPDDTKNFMESRMGYNFDKVRVHTGGQSDSLNRAISAKAFTTGSDIFIKSNEYSPHSDAGKQLLAHELTHVVQQGHANPKVQPERDEKKQ